jgi:hypothetical protein
MNVLRVSQRTARRQPCRSDNGASSGAACSIARAESSSPRAAAPSGRTPTAAPSSNAERGPLAAVSAADSTASEGAT